MRTKLNIKAINISLVLIISIPLCFAQIPADFIYWKFNSGAYNNAPLIKDSVMYCGSMDSTLYAINIKTGEDIWSYKTGFEISSTPAIQDDIVCVVAGCKIYILNAETGEMLWDYVASDAVPDSGNPTGYHRSSPVIYNDIAYYGDEWGNLNGVNILTGELAFQYTIDTAYTDTTDYFIRTKPAIKDDIVYFGDHGARVYAVSVIDSTEKWIHYMDPLNPPGYDGSLVSEVVLRDSSVYIGGYNNSFSPLDINTGNPRWQFTDGTTFLPSTPVFYNDNIILGTTIYSNHIHCLNVANGETVWSTKVKGIFFTKPVFVNDSILVINSTDPFTDKVGVVYFINCNNGAVINQIFIDNATESYPVISGDTLYLGINDGMYAINYKPYLDNTITSDLTFDASAETIVIDNNQELSISYPIINNSNFCDSIFVTYTLDGDDSKSNIRFTGFNKRIIRPSQTLHFSIRAPENTLNAGSYSLKFNVYSYHNDNESLFEKDISIDVNNVSSVNAINESNCTVYPNPFTSKVIFESDRFAASKVRLSVYSVQGSLVYSNVFNQNNEIIEWQGTDFNGKELKNGIYIYFITTDTIQMKGKLLKQ